ncbi:protein-glutamate O-methyltransferase CheR, partial [Methanosarcinales archaeon]
LIIGKTETLTGEAREKFICVNVQERIFRKPPR